jgi:hypothetical protein
MDNFPSLVEGDSLQGVETGVAPSATSTSTAVERGTPSESSSGLPSTAVPDAPLSVPPAAIDFSQLMSGYVLR